MKINIHMPDINYGMTEMSDPELTKVAGGGLLDPLYPSSFLGDLVNAVIDYLLPTGNPQCYC